VKKLILFGTRHHDEKNMPSQIRDALTVIIDKYTPQIVLEEWAESRGNSGAAAVCKDKGGLMWKSIGTPNTPEFTSYGLTYALDFPSSANIQRYGPISVQENREKLMCENITAAMASIERALVVIGLAHLHSMLMKLSSEFNVEGFGFGLEFF
jgi:hypothetical protein